MFMTIVLYAVIVLLAMISAVATVNMFAGPFLRLAGARARTVPGIDDAISSSPDPLPSVTVCIPARNEERNIGVLLSMLDSQTHPPMEVLVLDDQSTDATASIVMEHEHANRRIRLIQGKPLPEGWTGKNWACHQLAEESGGDVLLFVDADVRPSGHAVEQTVTAMARYRADALSAFPRQLFSGVGSAMVIPVMDVLLYGFLPLLLVLRSRAVSLAAANGQWFAFTREAYRRIGGHAAVRDRIVEDVELARAVKRKNGRMMLTSGNGSVSCRMYESLEEIREGFSKNFFAAFGFNTPVFIAVLLLLFMVFVLPFILLLTSLWPLALTAVGLNVFIRLLLSWRAGHGPLPLLLHPFGIVVALLIGLDAVRLRYRHGAVQWKDRRIVVGRQKK
jgi:chlorobactene glucosyltransferase